MALRSPCLLVQLMLMMILVPYDSCQSLEDDDDSLSSSIQGIQSQFEKLVTHMQDTKEELQKLKDVQIVMRNEMQIFMDGRCSSGSHNCHINATCIDICHGFRCECLQGFTGDGFTCEDVNECVDGTNACSQHATCTNDIGSYICQCTQGFDGDGHACCDVDECNSGEHTCSTIETCVNTYGNYCCNENSTECDCVPPFTYEEGLGCLFFEDNGATWDTARTLCHLRGGGDLFVLGEGKHQQFQDYLKKMLREGGDGVWVGAKEKTWLDGRSMTLDDWKIRSRGGHYKGDDCAMGKLSGFKLGHLESRDCTDGYKSICQFH